jgi:O-antigen ligase
MISGSTAQPTQSPRALLFFTSAAGGNIFWQIAIPLFLLSCFFLLSRILDPLGKHFKFTGILLALLAIALLASRRMLIFWKTNAGKLLPFFAAWFFFTYALSDHTELSFLYLQTFSQGLLLFIAAAVLLTTVADFKKLFVTFAAAGLAVCALGIVWGEVHNARFGLRSGPYYDSNYYAMCLLAITPVIWVSIARESLTTKLCACCATALPLLLTIHTASRGAFVALLAMLALLFFLSAIRMRILIGSLGAVGLVIMLAFLPNALRSRLLPASAAADQESGSDRHGADQNSADARQTLLMSGVVLTLNNPVFGVGPGNFGPTIVNIGKEQGFDWAPLNTHNAYTQVSSETGIPGILLFLALIFFSTRALVSLLRQTSATGTTPNSEIHRLASALLVSLAAILTCLFFLSEAYGQIIYLWLGLACGLRLLLPEPQREEDEFIEIPAAQLTPEP